MDGLRKGVKLELALDQKTCPLCGRGATDLHEIVCPPLGGSKYRPENKALAEAVYVKELCVLLCNACNTTVGNSRRDHLLVYNMSRYGVYAVVDALRRLAALLKEPSAYIPYSLVIEILPTGLSTFPDHRPTPVPPAPSSR